MKYKGIKVGHKRFIAFGKACKVLFCIEKWMMLVTMHFYECIMVNILWFKEKVKHEAIAYENEHQEHTSINMIYRRDLNEQYSIYYHPTIKM